MNAVFAARPLPMWYSGLLAVALVGATLYGLLVPDASRERLRPSKELRSPGQGSNRPDGTTQPDTQPPVDALRQR